MIICKKVFLKYDNNIKSSKQLIDIIEYTFFYNVDSKPLEQFRICLNRCLLPCNVAAGIVLLFFAMYLFCFILFVFWLPVSG